MRRTPLLFVVLAGCAPLEVEVAFIDRGPCGDDDRDEVDARGEGEGEDAPGGEGEGEVAVGEGEGEGEGEDDDDDDAPARYLGTDHSPLSRSVVRRLRALRAAHPELADDVFSKVGASNTVNTGFATCLDGDNVDLGGYGDLDDARAFFAAGDAAGTSPYDRVSASATVGWSTFKALQGDPRPVDVEVDAARPAFAVVLFGTNDIQLRNIGKYADDMLALTDALLDRGVIPLLSTVPPRADDEGADVDVPRYGLVARMIAESRQVPFLDLDRRLRALPDHGLGGDGIHMNVDPRGGCRFDDDGLGHGFNVRNLQTLQALAALKRSVVDEVDVFEPAGPPRRGRGTAADPLVVDVLPFTGTADTSTSASRERDAYDCAPAIDESGPEVTATVTLTEPGTLHALVFDQGAVDVDVHLLQGDRCLLRSDKEVVADVDAGTYTLVFDSFGGDAQAGPFQIVVYRD